jgi:hypothetical protein
MGKVGTSPFNKLDSYQIYHINEHWLGSYSSQHFILFITYEWAQ